MREELVVRHLHGDRFTVDVRGHTLLVDQPAEVGGTDTAPTPTELFAVGLTVSASYEIGGRATRVLRINVVVTPPADLPIERRDAFLAVASHCTVHNTLTEPADIVIALAATAAALN